MIAYLLAVFTLWLVIYLYQRRIEGMSGVLDSLPMFLLWNIFFWPLGICFMLVVFTAVIVSTLRD